MFKGRNDRRNDRNHLNLYGINGAARVDAETAVQNFWCTCQTLARLPRVPQGSFVKLAAHRVQRL
jgi:hypothetical protein